MGNKNKEVASPEQFQPVGVWQSLRDDGKARSCSTGKVARNETSVILNQPPAAALLQRRGRRRSSSGACAAAAADGPISQWRRPRGGRDTRVSTDRFREAPKHQRQTIFRQTPRAPCSRAAWTLIKSKRKAGKEGDSGGREEEGEEEAAGAAMEVVWWDGGEKS